MQVDHDHREMLDLGMDSIQLTQKDYMHFHFHCEGFSLCNFFANGDHVSINETSF